MKPGAKSLCWCNMSFQKSGQSVFVQGQPGDVEREQVRDMRHDPHHRENYLRI